MSFEKIQLSATQIVDLYKDNLVIAESGNVSEKKTPENKISFLGNNQKNICIVLEDEEAVHIREEWLQLLSNMLAACKLNIGDVAIVNKSRNSISFASLKNMLTPSQIILFGMATQEIELPFTIPHYQLQQYSQCSIVCAPNFSILAPNTNDAKLEKSKLWVSLKKMFNI